jgi:hypothetical protein
MTSQRWQMMPPKLQTSNVPVVSYMSALSSNAFNYIVIEVLPSLAKAHSSNAVVINPVITSFAHKESKKQKNFELNWHF